MNTKHEFQKRLTEVDSIFFVSNSLKNAFVSFLENLLNKEELREKTKKEIGSQIQMYGVVSDASIKNTEGVKHQELYRQAIVLLVSAVEATLKDFFKHGCKSNIDKIDAFKGVQIRFDELREKGEKLSFDDCVDIAIEKKMYSKEERDKGLNFQNIGAISGVLKGYFDIELSLNEEANAAIAFCFLLRNLIVHQLGVVDKKFLHDLKRLELVPQGLEAGEKISINKQKYELYKNAFITLFEDIDRNVKKSQNYKF
ncbi:MAG: hypothetical protein KC680_02650 [Candidatus Peregrinibacteria bacterium]|nr:hypothetical protein [Candidatus Peregrinibacteria bacterium]MCB9808602.1 hypothetical protein [Candidatus Peribacteria bacterium]